MHNAAPSAETDDGRSLLPNPYDGETPPQPPPRDLLASPTSLTGPTAWSYSTPTQDASTSASSSRVSRRVSAAPSAWTHDELHSDAASASSVAPLLARGDTQTSRLTASSSLHEEMTGYQKRLEAHHRKESEDAVMRENGIRAGAVPADPPPMYSAAVDM
uniref:Calcium dependent mitochondrial carrier protein n=1 Tax=Ganoderma boninense TaxID=34458 RepID=A0A5K1JZR6_9APHY|nr:Calcium dependent mitochondrial carrier protein [Ganoderma boninense]